MGVNMVMMIVIMLEIRRLVGVVAVIGGIVIGTLAAIEVAHCSSELVTLLPLEKQLSDLFASAFVFDGRRRFVLFLVLVLVVDGTEAVLGVTGFVFCLCVFSF
jgi:hypothetical protein